jgi:hypothetical protein
VLRFCSAVLTASTFGLFQRIAQPLPKRRAYSSLMRFHTRFGFDLRPPLRFRGVRDRRSNHREGYSNDEIEHDTGATEAEVAAAILAA